ncbi:hypothetical protein P3T69_17050 (plasmid) [Lactiplantibacillus plantarum]|nr:hypothetical protein P3T69_17050 [Lactiplantibacillus plantarum]
MSQFIIIGIINNLSTDFRVSIADIGALVTIFAIVYAVATPIINLSIGSIALHKVMLFFIADFFIWKLIDSYS